jgi:predicted hydrolase (HD superfamily)
MLLEEAHRQVAARLGSSDRAQHSICVGRVMKVLATRLGADGAIWEATGLCHDLDFFVTADDRRQHGILAASWLAGDLPPDALAAIRAHDHRTGVKADSAIADALKLADALAIAIETVGRYAVVRLLEADDVEKLHSVLANRPYLPRIIVEHSQKLGMPLVELAHICRDTLG